MRKKRPIILEVQIPSDYLRLTEIVQRLDRFDRRVRTKITRRDISARRKLDPDMRSKQPGDGVYYVTENSLRQILEQSFSGEVTYKVW